MKILLFIFTLTLYISPVLSQNNEVKDPNLNWSLENSLLETNQVIVIGLLEPNKCWNSKIDYDFNYENGWNWDTKLITAYGLNSIGGSKFLKKTDDKLEINSLLGKQFTNNLIGN